MGGMAMIVYLSESERLCGCSEEAVLLEDVATNRFSLILDGQRVFIDDLDSRSVDYAAVLHGCVVLSSEERGCCLVRAYNSSTAKLMYEASLPFLVRCGTTALGKTVLSGDGGIASFGADFSGVHVVTSSQEFGRIANRDLWGCGEWIVSALIEFGMECRSIDDLSINWAIGDSPLATDVVRSGAAMDSSLFAVEIKGPHGCRVDIIDSCDGTLVDTLPIDGRFVAVVDRQVIARVAVDDVSSVSAFAYGRSRTWSVPVSDAAVICPTTTGCWIQQGRDVWKLSASGERAERFTVSADSVIVAASERAVVFRRASS
jgi:hypothetical protein